MRGTLEEFTRDVEGKLLLLASLPDTQRFVATGFASDEVRQRLQQTFVRAAETGSSLAQLRILDNQGIEQLRVDRSRDGVVRVTPEAELQDRSDRDYVIETLRLELDGSYVSPLDLNTENGEVERPLNPVVRAATPLRANDTMGLLIIDISFADVLRLLPDEARVYTQSGSVTYLEDGSVVFREAALPSESLLLSEEATTVAQRWSAEGLIYLRFDYAAGRWILLALPTQAMPTDWGATSLLLASGLFLLSMLTLGSIIYQRYKQTLLAQRALTYALVTLVEGRDQETGLHLERTRRYATILATTMRSEGLYDDQLTQRFIDQLGEAALLHDIGKVTVPDAILQKPAALTDEEFDLMKRHVEVGSEMIEQLMAKYRLSYNWLPMARNICAYHHERYDGSGYQQGLSEYDIPLEARIFAVCDVYDALRASRPYKEPMPHRVAVAKIVEESGRHFDPVVVAGLQRCEDEFAKIHNRLADEEAERLEPILDIDAEGVWQSS